VNEFDVSVYAIRRRPGRRRPFEVRWRAAGRSKSKSFTTRRLADSYRAELVRAARMGLDFDPLTGEPAAWNVPEPAIVTWYEEATAYAVMKWPSLAAHSRASHLPGSGWGVLRLAAATPRTAAAWTSDGTSYEQRGLKHRPDGAIRMVPVPPVLVGLLRAHHAAYGTAPDGRLFRGARGGPLSGSVYGRAWQSARSLALGTELAASGLARRPYDLRHAALSLWLTSGGDPAQIAARAGHNVAVLLTVYSHCIHGRDDLLNQQIDQVLEPSAGRGPCPSVTKPAVWTDRATPPKSQRLHRGKSSGCINRDGRDAVRHASVTSPPGPPTAPGPRQHQTGTVTPESGI
jgi:integrase